jgi:hypothetical protein
MFPIWYIILQVICPLDNRLLRAELSMAALQFLTTIISWTAIYIYFRRTSSQLKNHQAARTLNAFQSLVALQAIQSLVFPLVARSSSYYPTRYVSYEDFSKVIPASMTCWESVIFAVFFIKIFSFKPYRNAVLEGHEHPATVRRAVLDTLNQMDIINGTLYLFQILFQVADKADLETEKSRKARIQYASVVSQDSEGN